MKKLLAILLVTLMAIGICTLGVSAANALPKYASAGAQEAESTAEGDGPGKPPTFWERYGKWFIFFGVFVLLLPLLPFIF